MQFLYVLIPEIYYCNFGLKYYDFNDVEHNSNYVYLSSIWIVNTLYAYIYIYNNVITCMRFVIAPSFNIYILLILVFWL